MTPPISIRTTPSNPSSAANLWFLTYRENSPLAADNWDAFRDPDAVAYKAYVTMQSDAETQLAGVLEAHAGSADAGELVAAVSKVLSDDGLRTRLQTESARFYAQRFSLERTLQKLDTAAVTSRELLPEQ